MAVTLTNIKNELDDQRRDSSADTFDIETEGLRAINRALRELNRKHDWYQKTTTIDFYGEVDDYATPSDYKSHAPISLRKQTDHSSNFNYVRNERFDEYCAVSRFSNMFSEGHISGNVRLKIKTSGTVLTLHAAEDHDANGTWVGANGAGNVTTDNNEKKVGAGSINFDLTSATAATLTNSTMTAVDLSSVEDVSKVFMWVYLPTVTNLTSVEFRFGSDASNYWTETITTDQLGDSLVAGTWNRIAADWDSSVGSPDSSAVDYIQFIFNYSSAATDTDFRINNLIVSQKVPLTFEYYSKNMVLDNGDSTTEMETFDGNDDSDTLLFHDDDLLDVIVDMSMPNVFRQQEEGNADLSTANNLRFESLREMQERHPTKRLKPTSYISVSSNIH
jgi:hypothetical protein